jgi:hypothetical protein
VHLTFTRTGLRGTLAVLATLLLLPIWAGPAHAQDAYRYWSYWWGADGAWTYAQTGPADRILEDGDVEGWLFLVSGDPVPAQQPAAAADFAAICSQEEAVAGSVRVGVVIDYGSPDIAPDDSTVPDGDNPETLCITVAEGSNAEQVLAKAASVRAEQGATCAINDYPATGCFEVVPATAASPSAVAEDPAAQSSSSPPQWIWLAAGALAVLAGAVVVLVNRNRRTPSA